MPDNIVDSLRDHVVPIGDINPHPENYNKHDIGKIKESLQVNGQYRPIVVNRRDRTILAGNGTYAAARGLGWNEIAVTYVDADETAARRILLVDNFAATDEYDIESVMKLLDELGGDLHGTGVGQADFEKMMASLNGGNADESGGKMPEAYGFSVIVEADDEAHQAELLEHFDGMGLRCRAFTM
jgi:hypothetical protein